MAIDYLMPKLAMGMNEGTVVEWLVKDGQYIERGQPLCNVETEKTIYDVEAPGTGWFQIIVQAGETVPAESLIGRIAASEDEYRALRTGVAAAVAVPATADAAGPADRLMPPPTQAAGEVRASPIARRMAKEAGIDLASIRGSGPEGRIVERDVQAALQARGEGGARKAEALPGRDAKARIPLKGMRAAIARRMTESLRVAAQLSHFAEVDVTRLMAVRETGSAPKLSPNAFVAKAIAMACLEVPIANASLVDDEIILWDAVNIGIAVAIPGQTEWDSGIVVPVLRDAQRKSVAQIDAEMRDLAARARAGQLKPGETEGGTITLSPTSALLDREVYSWSTPVLNLPQALIVQPGQALPRPVVRDGQIVVRTMMPVSLTFDHRILDGEPVGRFFCRLHDCLLEPARLLA